jgi:hypothetical protein
MKSCVLLMRSRWKIGVQAAGWTLKGGLQGRCLTGRYPQAPGSPYQWPTDDTVFRDRFQKTMLGEEQSIHADEHKQPGSNAEGSGQIRLGGRDVLTRAQAV